MKKFFKYLGVSILLGISFFYTEKTASVVKELDSIMIEIRDKALEYRVAPIQAIKTDTTFIPGVNGLEIDIDKSYREMRYIGKYNEKYLKYKTVYVENKLKDNLDKYIISGNKSKKDVGIVFIVENNDNIDNLLKILRQNEVSSTFMVSGLWLEKNNDDVYKIVEEGHDLGSIGYNYSYIDSSYPWLDNIIKRISKEKNSYCLKSNIESLEICKRHLNYSIDAKIIDVNPLIETKKILDNGSILIYKVNSSLYDEIDFLLKYVNSKGYRMVTLKKLLQE